MSKYDKKGDDLTLHPLLVKGEGNTGELVQSLRYRGVPIAIGIGGADVDNIE